jgi:hypothetical protein
MIKRMCVAGVLALAAVPAAAQAQALMADEFARWCSGASETDLAACRGYLTGMLDMNFLLTTQAGAPRVICQPEGGMSSEAVRGIVTDWLAAHSADLASMPARDAVAYALRAAWTCP